MTETKRRNILKGHRISWWVYASDGMGRVEKLRHVATMRGGWTGWDATCECGWETATGGAIKSYVERQVWWHKRDHRDAQAEDECRGRHPLHFAQADGPCRECREGR